MKGKQFASVTEVPYTALKPETLLAALRFAMTRFRVCRKG